MPLSDLVEYFNQRISNEQGLTKPPLTVRAGQVAGRFGELRLATEFEPIHHSSEVDRIVGHDAILQAFQSDAGLASSARVYHDADIGNIINLDRLCRTIHMLNYLPIAHEDYHLFLQVHPRHVLGVKRDHGAYFEEVIFRCGLQPRRVVITVPITPVYDRQLKLLLEGLKNYQDRGYGTAIKFDDKANEQFLERYCIEFLYRVTPDFVRLDSTFFSTLKKESEDMRRKTTLLSVIHGMDTQLLVEGVLNEKDFLLAKVLRADLVKGAYYDRRTEPLRQVVAG
ncbi:EAL domain-containing protein [Candidatus Methylospira mobilis]|uniref:EAL domain-containing protein n=1 Tax=Candidatus Methylospira mobilis TaxID=1808979 RepID=A0A5Q0BJT0_9GAMM|nr:EAL domain-containing protein [Candidatus Methylospira mobilis]QFY43809.1 EAL domain-containing protein [Candidatus Methylospira mobilis]WNV04800.1 EAL domain-containing protein [Candidatus Methylospira mobilis]